MAYNSRHSMLCPRDFVQTAPEQVHRTPVRSIQCSSLGARARFYPIATPQLDIRYRHTCATRARRHARARAPPNSQTRYACLLCVRACAFGNSNRTVWLLPFCYSIMCADWWDDDDDAASAPQWARVLIFYLSLNNGPSADVYKKNTHSTYLSYVLCANGAFCVWEPQWACEYARACGYRFAGGGGGVAYIVWHE